MITTTSSKPAYQVIFSNGVHSGTSDTTADKGGSNTGFRPHDLLEAALGSCMNMWLQMYAEQHQVPLRKVNTTVALNRSDPEKVVFEYTIELTGDLTKKQRDKLLQIAGNCPVRRTLSKAVVFKQTIGGNREDFN
jgi:putative redox protein